MPTYLWNCSDCGNFENFCSFAELKETCICPSCLTETTQRVYTLPLSGFVKLSDSELKLVGHLAERNREKMSDDQRAELHRKHNEYKYETPTKALPKGMSRMK